MEWRIAGAYIASCSCELEEHWPIDGTLSDTHGGCKGMIVFAVTQGRGHRSDLTGLSFALVNFFPQQIGGEAVWEMGLAVDERASIDQTQDIEDIIGGKHGGPFADLAGMVGEYLGTEHTAIHIERGPSPIVKVEGMSTFRFDPNTDPEGHRLVGGAPVLDFATDRVGGRCSGPPARAFGAVWTPNFGEYARFDIDDRVSGVGEQLRRLRT